MKAENDGPILNALPESSSSALLAAVERKWAHEHQQDQEWARAAESINDLRQMEYFLGRRSARADCERDIKEALAANE